MSISKTDIKLLCQLYLGELCVIYLNKMNVVVADESMGEINVSPMVQGIVMEVTGSFIHLGDGEMINKSIKHDDYGVIELAMHQESVMDYDLAVNESEIN